VELWRGERYRPIPSASRAELGLVGLSVGGPAVNCGAKQVLEVPRPHHDRPPPAPLVESNLMPGHRRSRAAGGTYPRSAIAARPASTAATCPRQASLRRRRVAGYPPRTPVLWGTTRSGGGCFDAGHWERSAPRTRVGRRNISAAGSDSASPRRGRNRSAPQGEAHSRRAQTSASRPERVSWAASRTLGPVDEGASSHLSASLRRSRFGVRPGSIRS